MKPDDAVPTSELPESADTFAAFLATLPKAVRIRLQQLKSREADIDKWFQADRRRYERLVKNPKKTVAELARAIKWEGAPLEPSKNLRLKLRWPSSPVGSELLFAV